MTVVYLICFVRDPIYPTTWINDYVLLGTAETLEEAKNKRKVSGDLIFYFDSKKIVKDITWLWEHDDYAMRCIKQEYRLHPNAIIWGK